MVYLKTDEEIELLRESNLLVAKTLGELAKVIKPGVTTLQLDKIAETFIRDHKGVPGFLNYQGFPNTLCTSVNDQVVHGIPNDKPLNDGDIVSIDCGVLLNGFYGDCAYTFEVGQVDEKIRRLLQTTKESLYKGIEQAFEGNRLGDIGHAVQTLCESRGYSVVREMVGHGIGRKLHEPPEVPNYGRKGSGIKLRKGMVIAVEPMINLGKRDIKMWNDNWTISTIDKSISAHYEHTIAIGKNEADILSSFKFVEEVLTLQS
ncbi:MULTISPECIES: type I methionyl aminopeptidase [Marinilabiliaceae]|uniref:Methionine aminopeptidase n=2 Tax=Marinilabiliaceae TaxID=558415 RepID=A0A1T5HQF0_9BACT|nr:MULTISPECIES: type I methionyl aminopeptidase [Marinilabiliaceae]ASB48459.1 type I methionyl aminopeptidase [Alkalitalea saponilacus]TCO04043.1 methionyl aminopeptidase [Natronoflexus pectinivorans]SKC22837.1 methionyl aminopeptidase [Alkalitalea saponilacus]